MGSFVPGLVSEQVGIENNGMRRGMQVPLTYRSSQSEVCEQGGLASELNNKTPTTDATRRDDDRHDDRDRLRPDTANFKIQNLAASPRPNFDF